MKEWIQENQHASASSSSSVWKEDQRSVEQFAMDNCKMLVNAAGEERVQKFTCKTCNKEFSSFQALGGHMASHRLPRIIVKPVSGEKDEKVLRVANSFRSRRMHKCPICGLEFPAGQALGGHMRWHRLGDHGSETTPDTNSNRFMLDLNLTPYENYLLDCRAAAFFL